MQEYLKINDLVKMGFKDSSIRRWQKNENFPKNIKIGRDRYWIKAEIEQFLEKKRGVDEVNNNPNK